MMLESSDSPSISPLITKEELRARIEKLGNLISNDFQGSCPVFLVVLRGAFVFAADLIRATSIQSQIDFIQLRSYGVGNHADGTLSSGSVELIQMPQLCLENRDVIVVEDIVDTGLTFQFLLSWLKKQKVRSVKTAALLHKPSRQKVPSHIDYLGFTIEDSFVVGYGLDLNQRYRYLPFVGVVHEPKLSS